MSEEENRIYFSKKDITFYGDTEKEKKLNEQLFDASLLIAQKDDEIKELKNIIKEVRELCEKQFISYEVNSSGNKIKRYAPISTNKIMEILGDNDEYTII